MKTFFARLGLVALLGGCSDPVSSLPSGLDASSSTDATTLPSDAGGGSDTLTQRDTASESDSANPGDASRDAGLCGPGTQACGQRCVDTLIDPQHCGDCTTVCGAGEVCAAGKCAATCPAGFVNCSGSCINPLVDRDHCGATAGCGTDGGSAGATCSAGNVCGNGTCQLSCPRGLLECGGSCVDPMTSRGYCGASEGCGADGGSAGTSCAAGQICGGGVCLTSCPAGLLECGGTCVDPNSNRQYCGASSGCGADGGTAGTACSSGQVCNAGICETSCQAGTVNCNGSCIDPLNNGTYCGATDGCGNDAGTAGATCAPGHLCANGACQLSCPGNLVECSSACIDPLTNPTYCGATAGCGADAGAAGATCSAFQACVNGACQNICPSGFVECGGSCIDPKSSAQFCGATPGCGTGSGSAGVSCSLVQACLNGGCYNVFSTLDVGTHVSTFNNNTRGYWFTSPVNFTIARLRVPTDIGTDVQNIQVVKFTAVPPVFSASTTNYTTLFYVANFAGDWADVGVSVSAGDIIGILGTRGTTANSYRPGPYATTILGQSVTLTRLLYQGSINTAPAGALSQEGSGSIARVEMQYTP